MKTQTGAKYLSISIVSLNRDFKLNIEKYLTDISRTNSCHLISRNNIVQG